jgi:predicted nucleic acid-binding protein
MGEHEGAAIRNCLVAASVVVTSDLTLVECDRVLTRAASLGRVSEVDATDRHARLGAVAAHWTILPLGPDVIERARRPFPPEPIRALDALHLASALVARRLVPGLAVLSVDMRVRSAAHRLGFPVLPGP